MKTAKCDVYDVDIKLLDELIPNNDSFADKLHVALGMLKEYEDVGPDILALEERNRRDRW